MNPALIAIVSAAAAIGLTLTVAGFERRKGPTALGLPTPITFCLGLGALLAAITITVEVLL